MNPSEHSPLDSAIHRAVLLGFLDRGHAPRLPDLAHATGASHDAVRASLERLHANHGLVLHPDSHDVWVAHPFTSTPSNFYVEPLDDAAAGRGWWASCIWCALGIASLAARPVRLHTRLGAEHAPATIEVRDDHIQPRGLVAHFPIPVARAWSNVHHFCGSTLVFDAAADINAWCVRHGFDKGDIVPLDTLARFARAWYGGHLSPTWRKPTVAEARQMIHEAGLTGPTWDLQPSQGRF